MQVNLNIDTSDLKNCGVIMKKRRVVVEEQSSQEPKPKRKHQTKVNNKKARNCEYDFVDQIVTDTYTNCEDNFCSNKFASFHMLVRPFHSGWANKYQLEDYKYQLCKISRFVFNLISNTFGSYEEIRQ